MAYCPEDGTEMEGVRIAIHACYQCPHCGTHWLYNGEEGAYLVITHVCPSCNQEVGGA